MPGEMTMPLSDEQWEVVHEIIAEKGDPFMAREAANIAYTIGIEYGRQVKKLLWVYDHKNSCFDSGDYRVQWSTPDDYRAHLTSGRVVVETLDLQFTTEHKAKALCQAHYDKLILSALEAV